MSPLQPPLLVELLDGLPEGEDGVGGWGCGGCVGGPSGPELVSREKPQKELMSFGGRMGAWARWTRAR